MTEARANLSCEYVHTVHANHPWAESFMDVKKNKGFLFRAWDGGSEFVFQIVVPHQLHTVVSHWLIWIFARAELGLCRSPPPLPSSLL